MQNQIVPEELLQKSDKILFLTHLALGDFTYMQNYFKAFSLKYPHIKINIWVDQVRGKSVLFRLGIKRRDILFDWLDSCEYINVVYKDMNSWRGFSDCLKIAKKQNYPLVISLGTLRDHRFAKYARLISPKGFKFGFSQKSCFFSFIKKYRFNRLSYTFSFNSLKTNQDFHITDLYAKIFIKLFAVELSNANKLPFISFPKKWSYFGKLIFLKWGILKKDRRAQKTVFINSFAKTKKRCWPMDNVLELISNLQLEDDFYDANFIINVLPSEYRRLQGSLKNLSLNRIFLFTADVNFFQLPAILSLCDLVISVETSIIHLAAALRVSVVALMRQKNPEWVPLGTKYQVVATKNRREWVEDISVEDVSCSVKTFV